MASTYTANSGIEKPGSGEQSGTWGTTTNTNFDIIDRVLNGVGSITLSGTTHTLSTSDGSLSDGHYKVLVLGGTPSGTNTVTISPNDQDKLYLVKNSSGQSVVFTQGSGGNATLSNGETAWIFADGAGAGSQVQKAGFSQLDNVLDTNGNNIEFPDSSGAEVNRLKFGAGDDVSVYWDGTDGHITTLGTLNIDGADGHEMATFTDGGSVALYHNDSKKIETTSAGVNVTGTMAATSFTVDNGSNDWTVTISSNKLRFNYQGTAKMELDTGGNLKVTGDVTAFGTI